MRATQVTDKTQSLPNPTGTGPVGRLIMLSLAALALIAAGAGAIGLWGEARFATFEHWWLLAIAPGFLIAAATWGGAWRAVGLVAASFYIGLATQLALQDPYWFQHVRMRPQPPVLVLMLAALALQPMIALAAIWRFGVLGKAWTLVRGIGLKRVLLLAMIMLVLSASMMQQIALKEPVAYARQLVIALAFLGFNIASFAALLAAYPDQETGTAFARLTRTVGLSQNPETPDDRTRRRRLTLCLAFGLVITCALMAHFALGAAPHLDDVLYLFQARYLADGNLTIAVPPDLEAFDYYLMDQNQVGWFATTFPGWPAMLAVAQTLGLEFWLSPILGGLGVVLMYRLVSQMVDARTALIAAALMAVSPWYIMSSSNPLIHTYTAVLILGCWLLLLRASRNPSLLAPFGAGLLMGLMFLARPLEGLLIGTLSGLVLLPLLKDLRHLRTVIAYGLGCLILAGLIFPYNLYLTGDALAHPLNVYINEFWAPGSNAFGFGADRGAVPSWGVVDPWPGHGPLEALLNAHQNLHEVNNSLLGWGGASLTFTLIYFIWGRWTRFTAALAVICGAVLLLYSLYWYYGGYFIGARYWFMMLIPLLIFTALGIQTAANLGARIWPSGESGARIGLNVALLGLTSLLIYASWIATNRYPGANDYHADYRKLAGSAAFENALVFINLEKGHFDDPEYGSAFWLNDFHPEATTPLFARDLGPDRVLSLAQAYPDRVIYFVDGRSTTVEKVTITRGPLTLEELENSAP